MKLFPLILLFIAPFAMASIYECEGHGFKVDITNNPLEMTLVGPTFKTKIQNLKYDSTFDTTFSGNSISPRATVKLIIKDSSFANPGDLFKALLLISSGVGIQEYPNLSCIRGED